MDGSASTDSPMSPSGHGGADTAEVRAANATWVEFADITLGALIGSGAYGQVYRGSYGGHDVAIKRGSVRNRDAQAQRYLAAELEALSACGEHPCLLRYYGACLHGGNAYIVTEFMPGGDLSGLLNDLSVELPWRVRVKLARDVAEGMTFMHSKGLIHRDIKGDNILLDDNWRAVLADYGFARRVEGSGPGKPAGGFTPAAMTILGSSTHMAPEVLFGEAYDQRADVFSFGTVLAHMLTRRAPGTAGFMERSPRGKFALDLDSVRAACPPDAPSSLVEACIQCLAYEPEERLDSSMVLDWLTELLADQGGSGADAASGLPKPSDLLAARRVAASPSAGEGEGAGGDGGGALAAGGSGADSSSDS